MSESPTSDDEIDGEIDDEIDDEIDEAIIVQVSDHLDGALADPARAEVARKIAEDATWKRAHTELTETRRFLSGLQKAHARPEFTADVTSKIHERSAGRFFGRRTLGDRVPFGVLLIVALAGLLVIGYILWSSSTGSLKVDHAREPQPHPGSAAVLP
ncbi:MAG: hypothetical protein ABIY55_15670 [Kofleriaceae bacterium]